MSKGDIYIRAQSDQIEKARKMLVGVPNGVGKALSRSINHATIAAKAEAVRAVSEEYTPKQKSIRPHLKVKKSDDKRLTAVIKNTGRKLNLFEFKVSPKTDTTGNKRKPIRVQVQKGGGDTLTRSFVHDGWVYSRIGTTGKHIRRLFGPAVPMMLNNENVVERVTDKAIKDVDNRLPHEVGRLLDKAVK